MQDINNWILFFATKEKQFKIVIKYFEYLNKYIKIVKEILKKT